MALADNLNAYWNFDETTGNLIDQVNSNDGVLSGGVTQNESGKVGTSYDFDGTDGIVTVPDDATLTLSKDMSISCWVKRPSNAAHTILIKGVYTEDGYLLMITAQNFVDFYTSQDGAWQRTVTQTVNTIPGDTWTHIVVSVDDGTCKLYINGAESTTYSYDGVPAAPPPHIAPADGATPLIIGQYSTIFFDGNMDELGLWNRALSPAEVTELYNSGNGLYFPFTEKPISKSETLSLTDSHSINNPTKHISKSETLSLSETALFGNLPTGTANKNTFWVNNFSGGWIEFNHYEYFRVKKKQNQASEFEVKIYDISTTQKAYFKEQAEVLFFAGETMILKGRIQNIEYGSAYEVVATGFGMEAKLLDKQFIKSGDNRVQYTNESAQTIADEINNSILTTASSGIWDTDFGNISMRFEHANRLNALAKTADAIDYYWWINQTSSDDYGVDYLNLASNQGETSSQKTFALGSTSTKTSQEKDIMNVVNYVYGLGYGDGVNQLKTSVYAASTQSDFLSANITATDSSIGLVDSSDFDATGSARIAEEQFTYAGINSNTLTGCTRGVSSTARAHNKNCYVEQHFASDSPQAGSSIQTYGLMDHSLINKSIVDLETLEVISSGYLSDRKSPIIRIKITPDEPLTDATLNIGDNVTVTDAEANISGDYRIVGIEYISNDGVLTLEIEVSNKSLEFVEQMSKAKQEAEDSAKYMQGSTNIYAISEAENCGNGEYLNLRFFIPNEAVAINKVLLNFKLEDYRAYSSSNANESSHTHGFSAIADTDTDNNISGTLSTSTWEDLGGSVNVTVASGEKVLILYSMGLDQNDDPPLSEMDLRIQRDINGGGYSTLNESIAYWVPGENSYSSTRYWSCAGVNFLAHNPSSKSVTYDLNNADGEVQAEENSIYFYAPVSLPHGATVTYVKVYGNEAASAETWSLKRHPVGGGSVITMATDNINSSDTSISSATINNSSYQYILGTTSLDTGDQIYTAKITYTLPGSDASATFNLTLGKTILDSPSAGSVTYKLQMNGDAGNTFGALGSGTLTAIVFNNSSTTETGSAHTHGINYGINEQTLTSPSVDLYTGEDGGSMTEKATYTTDQNEIDLTTEVSAIGAGKWINLQFRPNKNMRVEANAYVQIFLESK